MWFWKIDAVSFEKTYKISVNPPNSAMDNDVLCSMEDIASLQVCKLIFSKSHCALQSVKEMKLVGTGSKLCWRKVFMKWWKTTRNHEINAKTCSKFMISLGKCVTRLARRADTGLCYCLENIFSVYLKCDWHPSVIKFLKIACFVFPFGREVFVARFWIIASIYYRLTAYSL